MELDRYKRDGLSDHPPYLSPAYASTVKRSPSQPLVEIPQTQSEAAGPVFDQARPEDSDLTRQHRDEPQGQRIVVHGKVMDEAGRPAPHTLIEIWQANAAGRYKHENDQHPAPLDPNFTGAGRAVTGADGRYRFTTIRPGAYPWRNHPNAWRPAHIHFSLFGPSFLTRLITQMYFPGDPLFPFDPIFNAIPDEAARDRLISHFDLEATTPEWALGYRFDIVLRGPRATPVEDR